MIWRKWRFFKYYFKHFRHRKIKRKKNTCVPSTQLKKHCKSIKSPLCPNSNRKNKNLRNNSIKQDEKVIEICYTPKYLKAVGHLHNGILLILDYKKGWNITLCNNADGPGEHYAKWNKPDRERQIPYEFTYMWNLINKLTDKIETDSYIENKWQLSEKWGQGWVQKVKTLCKKKNDEKTPHRYRQWYGAYQRERWAGAGGGGDRRVCGQVSGNGKRLDLRG